jgi:hypothetical protein
VLVVVVKQTDQTLFFQLLHQPGAVKAQLIHRLLHQLAVPAAVVIVQVGKQLAQTERQTKDIKAVMDHQITLHGQTVAAVAVLVR